MKLYYHLVEIFVLLKGVERAVGAGDSVRRDGVQQRGRRRPPLWDCRRC